MNHTWPAWTSTNICDRLQIRESNVRGQQALANLLQIVQQSSSKSLPTSAIPTISTEPNPLRSSNSSMLIPLVPVLQKCHKALLAPAVRAYYWGWASGSRQPALAPIQLSVEPPNSAIAAIGELFWGRVELDRGRGSGPGQGVSIGSSGSKMCPGQQWAPLLNPILHVGPCFSSKITSADLRRLIADAPFSHEASNVCHSFSGSLFGTAIPMRGGLLVCLGWACLCRYLKWHLEQLSYTY